MSNGTLRDSAHAKGSGARAEWHQARVSFSGTTDSPPPHEGMSTLVSDRFKMDSPSSGPPMGTGAASLLEGAVGTPAQPRLAPSGMRSSSTCISPRRQA